jgi:hypothetical protein
MSSIEIISPEVKLRRKISKNQLSVIFEPNIQKKLNDFFGITAKFFMMFSEETIL